MNAFSSEFDGLDELLSAYLDGELSPADRAQVDALLAEREDYRAALAELRSLRSNMLTLPPVKVSAGFYDRVLVAISQATIEDAPAPEAKPTLAPATEPPLAAVPSGSAPQTASHFPAWSVVAACALAASVALALFAPDWWNRTEDPIGQAPDVRRGEPAAPKTPSLKQPSEETLAKSRGPETRGVTPPAPAKPVTAAGPSEKLEQNANELQKRAAAARPSGGEQPAHADAKLRTNPPKAELAAKAENGAAPGAGPGRLMTPETMARRKSSDGNAATEGAGARDQGRGETLVIAQLQLSADAPSREALRDLLAWQDIHWDNDAGKDRVAERRLEESGKKNAGADGGSGKGEAKGEGGSVTEYANARFAKAKADGIDSSVDAIYLETTPERWREMQAMLGEWKGTRLSLVQSEALGRAVLNEVADRGTGGSGAPAGPGGVAMAAAAPRGGSKFGEGKREQVQVAEKAADPNGPPAPPAAPVRAFAPNANQAIAGGAKPSAPTQAGPLAKQPMLDGREAEEAAAEGYLAERSPKNFAFPVPQELSKQLVTRSDQALRGNADGSADKAGSADRQRKQSVPSEGAPAPGVFAAADEAKGGRVRVLIVLKSDSPQATFGAAAPEALPALPAPAVAPAALPAQPK